MSQSDPALAIRVSAQQREGARAAVERDKPRLRLLVTKGQLGVELDAPFELGPLSVEELALSFLHVRFPVELSGGVSAFRNRRGQLQRVRLRVSGAAAERWAAPRLQRALAAPVVHQVIAPLEDGWLIGVATSSGALAFEVVVAPLDGDLRLLPTNARAVGFRESPQALAMRLLMALAHPHGRSVGSAVIIERGPMTLAQELMPLAGMRAPAARKLCWSRLEHDLDGSTLLAERDDAPMASTERAVRAVELAALVADAERHLLVGDLERARHGYLTALTRAPRHLELARRLAALDVCVGGRAEAALSTLVEVQPPLEGGALGASLLQAVGDEDGARTAWRRAAMQEPFGPLAALCWLELGRISTGDAAELALDEAIARAPVLTAARWLRFEQRVRRGRIEQARADVAHLEAQAEGALERLEVLRGAADFLLGQRVIEAASELYERALRYRPADVEAIAGLAGALSLLGQRHRALELMSRAAALVERSGRPAPRVTLDFARALAEVADDRPAAVSHVARIEHLRPGCFEARLLEARWRAELGDLSGASVSLGILADALESVMGVLVAEDSSPEPLWSGAGASYPTRADARRALAAFAEEGARIQELDRRDVPAARRLIEIAIRLAPRVPSIRASFRRLALAPEAPSAPQFSPAPTVSSAPAPPPAAEFLRASELSPAPEASSAAQGPALDTVDGEELEAAGLEARIELLTMRVRANPEDEEAVSELITVLERLERYHDLLALLSARIDEAPEAQRGALSQRRRGVLRRMVDMANAEGRPDEAELYTLMLGQD